MSTVGFESFLTAAETKALAEIRRILLADQLGTVTEACKKVIANPEAHIVPATAEKLASFRTIMNKEGKLLNQLS